MNTVKAKRVVSVSIKTTGPSEIEDEIIEIGAVKLTNSVVSEQFQVHIKPKVKMSETEIERVGISSNTLALASSMDTAINDFIEFSKDCVIVAYDTKNVLRFLIKASYDLNLQFMPLCMDLLAASKALFPNFNDYDLYTLCNRFGIPTIPMDNTIDEARACIRLYRTLTGEMEERCISASIFYMPITPELIIHKVCKYYGVSKEELIGMSRCRQIVYPRRIAMYLIRKMIGTSFVNIGTVFNRDHGTVLYAVNMIEKELDKDTVFKASIQDIVSSVEQRI